MRFAFSFAFTEWCRFVVSDRTESARDSQLLPPCKGFALHFHFRLLIDGENRLRVLPSSHVGEVAQALSSPTLRISLFDARKSVDVTGAL